MVTKTQGMKVVGDQLHGEDTCGIILCSARDTRMALALPCLECITILEGITLASPEQNYPRESSSGTGLSAVILKARGHTLRRCPCRGDHSYLRVRGAALTQMRFVPEAMEAILTAQIA